MGGLERGGAAQLHGVERTGRLAGRRARKHSLAVPRTFMRFLARFLAAWAVIGGWGVRSMVSLALESLKRGKAG